MIKQKKCACGATYVDFQDQIGECPACSEDSVVADAEQVILKAHTYVEENVLLRKLLRECAIEGQARKAKRDLEEAAAARAEVKRLTAEESMASCAPKRQSLWDRIRYWRP